MVLDFLKLVQAVIETESGGDPSAVSDAGAKGLMQIKQSTFTEWRQRLGLGSGADVFNPTTNIIVGSAYLGHLIDRFKDHKIGILAYFIGPGATEKLIEPKGIRTYDELLPYLMPTETEYVDRVLQALGRL